MRLGWIAAGLAVAAMGCPSRPTVVLDGGRPATLPPLANRASDDAAAPEDGNAAAEVPRALAGPLEACIARVRGGTPPELVAVLDTLQYGAVADDACRMQLAASLRAPDLCAGMALSALREVCVARAAMATGRPDDCPAALGDRGRDPLCVAIASRATSLCSAALPPDALRCVALAHMDPNSCNALDASLRSRCRSDVAALAGIAPRSTGRALLPGEAHLRLAFGPLADGGAARTLDLELPDLRRGAYLGTDGVLYLVDPTYGWPGEFTVRPLGDRPVLGVALAVPARAGPGGLVDFSIVMPDGMVVRHPPSAVATVQFAEVGRVRGATVTGQLSSVGSATGVTVQVELTFHTFVRDVVAPAVIR